MLIIPHGLVIQRRPGKESILAVDIYTVELFAQADSKIVRTSYIGQSGSNVPMLVIESHSGEEFGFILDTPAEEKAVLRHFFENGGQFTIHEHRTGKAQNAPSNIQVTPVKISVDEVYTDNKEWVLSAAGSY